MAPFRSLFPVACAALLLAGCQGDRAAAPTAATAPSQAQSSVQSAEAESTVDGATVHVSAVQTSQLPESVARDYGIERSPRKILLLVNLRNLGDRPAPAITASVTDLQQHTTALALREVHVAPGEAGTTDYIGTIEATLSDTLRFTVLATRGGATAKVQMSRDFYSR